MQFVLASHNKKKMAEMAAILSGLDIEVVPLPENAPEPEENGATFEENAAIKAKSAADFTGLPAIADDSGLCVDALGGAPGVYSARYCGHHGDDEANNRKLLAEMQAVPAGQRAARFVSAVCFMLPDGRALTVEGVCPGSVAFAPAGENGFGYDPIFIVENLNKTMASLSEDEKNRISHRGRALMDMLMWIKCSNL